MLRVLRKGVDDPVHRFWGVVGVKRSEDQHPHGRAGEAQPDGVVFTHFPDEDDVRVGAHSSPQRRREGTAVDAHFAVDDGAEFVLMHEFDRVLNCKNMAVLCFINIVNHRCQSSGLT